MAGLRVRVLTRILLASCVAICALAQDGILRVRRELRDLSAQEYQLYIKGITTMLTVSTEKGQQLYGPAYKEYEHFIVQHAVATEDPRGDQGHSAPCFLSFHRAFVLEFENALLSVVPDLGALPYWDFSKDCRGGEYSNPKDPRYIFSNRYAGSLTGDRTRNYTVTNGAFPNFKIRRFDRKKWGFQSVYKGNRFGLLRGSSNDNRWPWLVRYPFENHPDFSAPWSRSTLWSQNRKPNEMYIKYSKAQFTYCHNPNKIPDWMSFEYCVDLSELRSQLPGTAGQITKMLSRSTHALLHTIPHGFVAGRSDYFPAGSWGDLADVSTAPNDVFLFFPHHANVDRSAMHWQTNAWMADSGMADRDVLWGYPVSEADHLTVDGCYREDVISSNFPFTDLFPDQPPADPTGYTHAEVLYYTRPEATPYTYDTLEDEGKTFRSSWHM